MLRIFVLGLAVSASLLVAGCPTEPPADAGDAIAVTPDAEAPESAVKGDSVALTARLRGGAEPDGITYQWVQIYGRAVEILDGQSAEASFVAPSLPTDQVLRFRVDVVVPNGTVYYDTVEITVAADPDYDAGASADDDGEDDPHPAVRLVTSMGTFVVELDREKAPLTVNNFLRYVDDGFYRGTIFHRVIADFVVQGGGFEPGLERKQPRSPIINESDNGLKNDRGTIAMARQTEYDSATSQFYINVVDNDSLNATSGANGYAVFGRVIQGMEVVDRIAAVETESRDGMSDVPVEDVVLTRVDRVATNPSDDGDDGGDGGNQGGGSNRPNLSGG